MNIRNSFISALRALNKNRMRSVLTSIGVIIGVSSVIIMVGISNSARVVVKNRIYNFGSNAMQVKNWKYSMSVNDITNLKQMIPQIKYITPLNYERLRSIKYLNKNMESKLYAVNDDFFRLKEWPLLHGRYFTEEEIESSEKVVVLGETVREELFGRKDPSNSVILINNQPFRVIGSLTEVGQALSGSDLDNLVVMPYTTAGIKILGRKVFNEIYVSVYDETMIEETRKLIRSYFAMKRMIPAKEDDFTIKTSAEKLRMADYISSALAILLAGVASISLFVGGVGIMNIMLVSVNERVREIGIRMAIGAKKKDILVQFLIESATLGAGGGLLGITLGLTGYYLIVFFIGWPFLLSLGSVIISFLFACAVGVFFGYYPARMAASLKPIVALRYE